MAKIRVILHCLLEVRRRSLRRICDLSRRRFHQVAHRQVHMRVLVMRQELTVKVLLRRCNVLVLNKLRVLSLVHVQMVMRGLIRDAGLRNVGLQSSRRPSKANIGVEVRRLERSVAIVLHEQLASHQLFHLSLTLTDLVKHGLAGALQHRSLCHAIDHQISVVVHVRATPIIRIVRLAGGLVNLWVDLVIEDRVESDAPLVMLHRFVPRDRPVLVIFLVLVFVSSLLVEGSHGRMIALLLHSGGCLNFDAILGGSLRCVALWHVPV